MEFQFYLLSPLIMWLVFSPARRAPRRYCLLGLLAASLVAVLTNLVFMLTQVRGLLPAAAPLPAWLLFLRRYPFLRTAEEHAVIRH